MRKITLILSTLMLVSSAAFAQTATPAKPATTPAQSMPAKPATGMPAKTTPAKPMAPMSKVAVNTATEAQLSAIPGVGKTLAAAIIKARPIKDGADLVKRVKGIGPKNYVSLGLDKVFTY